MATQSLQANVVHARIEFFSRKLIAPLHLSSGVISEATEARAEVTVRVAGREATGRGSIYLSDLWAWPDPTRTHEQRDAVLRGLCTTMADKIATLCGGEPAHPAELGLRLHHSLESLGGDAHPPILALAMCASPFDAAIHDAAGIALNRSAFDFYHDDAPIPGADRFFPGGAAAAVRRLLTRPRRELPAWVIVGKDDQLDVVGKRWFHGRGYRCYKLKLAGRDNAADAARTAAVYRAARSWGIDQPRLSVDTNEANPDAASVADYLERLRAADAEALAALEYLEQPTSRDILRHRHDWRAVSRIKPVMLDEGLTSLELLEEAVNQGWSGLALKTCKGHSFALIAAAWAHERGLLLSMQDLTNPGFSAIHSALFVAHVPTINGVELNSPQFTPDANREWLPRLASLLEPADGLHRLPERVPIGLGSTL